MILNISLNFQTLFWRQQDSEKFWLEKHISKDHLLSILYILHILAYIISFKTYNNRIITFIFLKNILNEKLITEDISDYRIR